MDFQLFLVNRLFGGKGTREVEVLVDLWLRLPTALWLMMVSVLLRYPLISLTNFVRVYHCCLVYITLGLWNERFKLVVPRVELLMVFINLWYSCLLLFHSDGRWHLVKARSKPKVFAYHVVPAGTFHLGGRTYLLFEFDWLLTRLVNLLLKIVCWNNSLAQPGLLGALSQLFLNLRLVVAIEVNWAKKLVIHLIVGLLFVWSAGARETFFELSGTKHRWSVFGASYCLELFQVWPMMLFLHV